MLCARAPAALPPCTWQALLVPALCTAGATSPGGLGTGTEPLSPKPHLLRSRGQIVAGRALGGLRHAVCVGCWLLEPRLDPAPSGSAVQCPTPLLGTPCLPTFRALGICQFARVVKGAALRAAARKSSWVQTPQLAFGAVGSLGRRGFPAHLGTPAQGLCIWDLLSPPPTGSGGGRLASPFGAGLRVPSTPHAGYQP